MLIDRMLDCTGGVESTLTAWIGKAYLRSYSQELYFRLEIFLSGAIEDFTSTLEVGATPLARRLPHSTSMHPLGRVTSVPTCTRRPPVLRPHMDQVTFGWNRRKVRALGYYTRSRHMVWDPACPIDRKDPVAKQQPIAGHRSRDSEFV